MSNFNNNYDNNTKLSEIKKKFVYLLNQNY